MKKSLIALITLSVLSISSVQVSAFTFEDAADDNGTAQTETATDNVAEDTATDDAVMTDEEINIANLDVMPNKDELPADGKSEVQIFIKVQNDNDDPLTDADVDLDIKVSDDNGQIKSIEYSEDDESFIATYVAGKQEGTVSFDIVAKAKNDPNVKLEQLEDFILTHYEEPKPEVKDEVADTLKQLDEAETEDEATEEETTEEKVEGINIVGSKIIDTNTIKITFDKKIFLPEDPLSLIEIKKSANGESVAIENVTLSNDEMGLVVLTSKPLAKEAYVVTVNEVIDGETKKKVSVANPELTVTGISDYFFLLIGMMLTGSIILRRRKKS